jgi:diguanylate cyclase (GGDEF)-like protein
MSAAMVDLGQAPALPNDRRRAATAAAVIVVGALLLAPVIARPLGTSYPIFAIVIALSISAIAITALLLWAQARVTQSFPLSVLAAGYALTSIVMVPYMLFYRGLWPPVAQFISADTQTSGWFWVEWHALFVGSAIAYYVARRLQPATVERDSERFRRLQRRLVFVSAALLVVTVPPIIWLDGLPALAINGTFTPLFSTISFLISFAAAAAIVLAYRTSRFRSVLDLLLSVACLSMLADLLLQHFSRQFSAGWYASRISILFAASAVLSVLLFQTATIYAQLMVTAERLRNESLTDVLTGLANRRSFDQRFAEMLRDCAREGRPLALLMIDVDHFKAFNDAFGHQAGDDCLRGVGAMLLNNAARARDLVARIGGEEMAVIMPEVDLAGALVVAERMRSAVQAAAIKQGSTAVHAVVTISIGVTATSDPARATVEDLLRSADRALYRAKDTGRNRVIELGEMLVLAGLPDA